MAYTAEICMSQPVVTVRADAPLDHVIATMERHQLRRVPVVDQRGRCVGIISQADVALGAEPEGCRRTGTRSLAQRLKAELAYHRDQSESSANSASSVVKREGLSQFDFRAVRATVSG